MGVNTNNNPSSYKAPAIGRAVSLLEYISTCQNPPTLSEISRALDFSKSTTHGLLHALEEYQWVIKTNGGFSLGAGLLSLARRVNGDKNIAKIARPFMEQLSADIGESVCVGEIEGGRVRIEECVEGSGEMRLALKPGIILPLFAGAVGKTITAGLTPQDAEKLLKKESLPRFTDNSITDTGLFQKEVERCRTSGYAVDDQEYLDGVRAVAAPIKQGDKTVAVLWVVGLTLTFTVEKMTSSAVKLTKAATLISNFIGVDNGTAK